MAHRLQFMRRLAQRAAPMLVGGTAAALTAGAAYNHADALGISDTKYIFESLSGISAKLDRIEKSITLHDGGKADVVLGAQWGDEGKGKLVDMLGSQYDICARVAGGSNAGHTIIVEGKKYAFHLSLIHI